MKFSKRFRIVCSLAMCTWLSNVPSVALAQHTMIPTSVLVQNVDRAQAEKNVQSFLTQENVRKALLEKGVSADEVSLRLASLSDAELRQLSGQVEQARAGGDILVAILIIVLIIFLIKRI
jgi:hypothetical protein